MLPGDLAILGVMLVTGLVWYGVTAYRTASVQRQMATAPKKVRAAAEVLAEQGFKVIGVNLSQAIVITTGDSRRTTPVKADLMAVRGGRRYVVEIFSGSKGSPQRLLDKGTRFRLMENFVAFRPDGVIFLNLQNNRLRVVEFGVRPSPRHAIIQTLKWAGAACVGAGIMYLFTVVAARVTTG